MTLYRAKPADGVAWITGASTGIGRQLALDLAARATRLPRPRAMPTIWKVSSRKRPPAAIAIVAAPCDVTDEKADGPHGHMDRDRRQARSALAIFNAGTYSPTHGERLEDRQFHPHLPRQRLRRGLSASFPSSTACVSAVLATSSWWVQ